MAMSRAVRIENNFNFSTFVGEMAKIVKIAIAEDDRNDIFCEDSI